MCTRWGRLDRLEVGVDDKPADLVPIAEAARAVDRSKDTVRRWLRTGALRRWEGERPAHGGSLPVLVSLAELRTLAVVAELDPDPPRRGAASVPPVGEVGQLAELRFAVERERHRAELAELRADLARSDAEREAAARDLTRLRADVADARAERDRWRERCEASEREGRELATIANLPWWRRLLG